MIKTKWNDCLKNDRTIIDPMKKNIKWLVLILALTSYTIAHAQMPQQGNVNITYADTIWCAKFLGPFKGLSMGMVARFNSTDSTFLLSDQNNKTSDIQMGYLSNGLSILTKNKNSSKFLAVSASYDLYKYFSMKTGYVFTYIVAFEKGKMNIYRSHAFDQVHSQKYIGLDLDTLTEKRLILSGDLMN